MAVGVLIFLILLCYGVWRCAIAGYASDSELIGELAELGPSDGDDELAKDDAIKRHSGGGDAVTIDERYLQRRREVLKRVRKLRTLNPAQQCLYRLFYRISDCVTCSTPSTGLMPTIETGGVKRQHPDESPASNCDRQTRQRKWWWWLFACWFCRPAHNLLRFRWHKKRKNSHSISKGAKSSHDSPTRRQQYVIATGVKRSAGAREMDEVFEAYTVGMQLQKPIAYVASASSAGYTDPSITNVGRGLMGCVHCGVVVEQLTSNLCSTCYRRVGDENWEGVATADNIAVNLTAAAAPTGVEGNDDLVTWASTSNISPQPTTAPDPPDWGFSLTKDSVQVLESGKLELGGDVLPEQLFNMPSMNHLLHPK